MKSLGELFQRESQKHTEPAQQSALPQPSRQDVLNYLGHLTDDYHIPRKVVYALADAESDVDPNKAPHPNYLRRHNHIVHKDGQPVVKSWDYGIMQINEGNIGGTAVDAHKHRFRIEDDIKTDWRANARARVALLAPAYHMAEFEQGPGATVEDHAQQAYSQYNSGSARMRDRYLKEQKDGLLANDADRNFLKKFRHW